MPTVSLYLKFFMIDLPALRSGFVKQQPLFTEHGVIASSLHVGVDQADLAFLHFVGTSRDELDALSKHSQLLEWLTAIGSKEAPQSFLGADVSRSRTYYDDFK